MIQKLEKIAKTYSYAWEEPLPETKVIGTKWMLSKLPQCKNCNRQISNHGYEIAGVVKFSKTAQSGSFILCPACYFLLVKKVYLWSTMREIGELSPILVLVGIGIFILGKAVGESLVFVQIILIVLFWLTLVLWIVSHIIKSIAYSTLSNLNKEIASNMLKSNISDIDDTFVDIEIFGLGGLSGFPRDKLVPCPIAVFVHKDNPIKDISSTTLSHIYSGTTSSWKILGWEDRSIKKYAPKDPCNESGAFRRILLIKRSFNPDNQEFLSIELPYQMREDPNAIGFALYSHHDKIIEQSLKLITIDNQECNYENGKYPLWVLPGDYLLSNNNCIHDWSEWDYIKLNACDQRRICKICNEIEEKHSWHVNVSHDWTDWKYVQSDTKSSKSRKCKRCNAMEEKYYVNNK